jgi:purine-binding chemotaxis protein CheW
MNGRAADLRQSFDRSFALPRNAGADAAEGLLAITLASTPFVVRLADVARLVVDRQVTWMPSPVPELRGIVGLRGSVCPVYDLAMLLGLPRTASSRWLLLAAGAPVALAFDAFDGYRTAAADGFVPAAGTGPQVRHVRELMRGEPARPVIHISSILDTIRSRSGRDGTT